MPAFDLVVAHGVFKFPFVDAGWAARRSGVPYIVQPHNSLDPYDLRKHSMSKSIYGPLIVRPLLRHAARVIVTSARERDTLVSYGARPAVDVVGLPVAGPARAPDGEAFRRRYGISPSAPVVLFVSRIDPKKGLERLLAAVRHLRATKPDIRLVVVGPPDEEAYERSLRREAERLGIANEVIWAGLVIGEDKWDAYAGADVFALPSDNENFGIVVLEALLVGTSAVISNEVYIADELAASGAPVYVCGTDVPSLVAQLEKALAKHDGAASEHSTTKVAAAFSPEAVTRATIAAYESALSGRGAQEPLR